MPQFCCTGECKNSSEKSKDLSFHSLPLDDKPLLKLWVNKMHRDPRYFNLNKHVNWICSKHLRHSDFVNPYAKKRRLKRNAVPSKFNWTPVEEEEEDVDRTAVSKLQRTRIEQDEAN